MHSHPFPQKSHNHTDKEIDTIDLLSQAICIGSEQLTAPEPWTTTIADFRIVRCPDIKASEHYGLRQLRAPPVNV
ncbi:MAG: hypothetical protein K5867_08750 [Bacteroidales bacterium]|nr:hypothetical protein [Bacteroidales bacterium]